MSESNVVPPHQWANADGEVLVVRFCAADGSSHNGFKHPVKIGERVTAPDWDLKVASRSPGGIQHSSALKCAAPLLVKVEES